MSVIDNALQALFKMAHKEILWENASPTSKFNPQDVFCACGDYDIIAINYSVANSIQAYGFTAYTSYKDNTLLPGEFVTSIDSSGNGIQFNFRNCALHANKITFYDARYKTSATPETPTQNNAVIIPMIIYGIIY